MNFFQQLHDKLIGVDLRLEIKRTGNLLKVSALPNTSSTMKPATITGTPEEIDAGFFEAIEKPLQDAQGLKTHYTPPDKPAAAAAKKEEKKQAPKKKKAESKNVVVEQAMEFGD